MKTQMATLVFLVLCGCDSSGEGGGDCEPLADGTYRATLTQESGDCFADGESFDQITYFGDDDTDGGAGNDPNEDCVSRRTVSEDKCSTDFESTCDVPSSGIRRTLTGKLRVDGDGAKGTFELRAHDLASGDFVCSSVLAVTYRPL